MNEQLTKTRTPETVGAEIRNLTAAARYLTVWYAVEIGRRLTEAKAIVPHGGWLDWLKTETEFSQPTASRFMRIFEEYGADQGSLFGAETKYSALNNLSVTNALKLLAVPEEERESFAVEVDAEHLSSRELEQAIKDREEAMKREKEAQERIRELETTIKEYSEENVELTDDLANAEAKVKELEARPIEVAVKEPDPAEIERRVAEATEAARADKEAAERLLAEEKEKAKAAADKLREQLKEAEDKLAAADEEDRAGAEQLEAEVAQLKKQLAMSSQEIVMFRIHFTAWQEAYQKMANATQTMTDEQREKCRAAIRAQVKGWGWCE